MTETKKIPVEGTDTDVTDNASSQEEMPVEGAGSNSRARERAPVDPIELLTVLTEGGAPVDWEGGAPAHDDGDREPADKAPTPHHEPTSRLEEPSAHEDTPVNPPDVIPAEEGIRDTAKDPVPHSERIKVGGVEPAPDTAGGSSRAPADSPKKGSSARSPDRERRAKRRRHVPRKLKPGPKEKPDGTGIIADFLSLLLEQLAQDDARFSQEGAAQFLLEAVKASLTESSHNKSRGDETPRWTRHAAQQSPTCDGLHESQRAAIQEAVNRFRERFADCRRSDMTPGLNQYLDMIWDDNTAFNKERALIDAVWEAKTHFRDIVGDMAADCTGLMKNHAWPDFNELTEAQRETIEGRKASLDMIADMIGNLPQAADAMGGASPGAAPHPPPTLAAIVQAVGNAPWGQKQNVVQAEALKSSQSVINVAALAVNARNSFFNFLKGNLLNLIHFLEDGARFSRPIADELLCAHPDHKDEIEKWVGVYEAVIKKIEGRLSSCGIESFAPGRGEIPDFRSMNVFDTEPCPDLDTGRVLETFHRGYRYHGPLAQNEDGLIVEPAKIIAVRNPKN